MLFFESQSIKLDRLLYCMRVESLLAADSDDGAGRRAYCKLVAGLLRDMGVVKCQLGEMAAGCQLLHESAGLYQWMSHGESSVDDVISVAEVRSSRRCLIDALFHVLHATPASPPPRRTAR